MRIITAVVGLVVALGGVAGHAQTYPARPVTFISSVTGGAYEVYERAILDKIKENTGAAMIFEGRPGGNGAPALQALKAAKPDGHVLGISFASAMNLNPLMDKGLGLDVLRDFQPIIKLTTHSIGMGAAESFQGKDLRDLVAMAKAKPGMMRIGVLSAGNKVWMTMLEERSGAKFLQVPYKTVGEVMAAVLGGQIDAYIDTMTSLGSQRARFKSLVNGGATPTAQQPGVPLMRDLYGFDMTGWYAAIAPAATPAGPISWMSREIGRAIRDPKIKDTMETAGFMVVAGSPEELWKTLRAEIEENAAVVRKYPDIL